MLIYPAIDIYDGKCVRLRQGNYSDQKMYSESPVDVAQSFLDSGLPYLHIVDLQGARDGRMVNREVIRSILALEGVQAQVGGGVRHRDDVHYLLGAGAQRIVLGSIAVKFPQLIQDWIQEYRSDRFVIAVDVRSGVVTHSGWLERESLEPMAFINTMSEAGATQFLCTIVERDGMLEGPDIEFYYRLRIEFPQLQLIASGGVSKLSDIQELEKAGCSGVIIGKALYEGLLKIEELAGFQAG
jgi:phosphoribosylformimino-5-aminoimidazole carboxamide ribotide isomerase